MAGGSRLTGFAELINMRVVAVNECVWPIGKNDLADNMSENVNISEMVET